MASVGGGAGAGGGGPGGGESPPLSPARGGCQGEWSGPDMLSAFHETGGHGAYWGNYDDDDDISAPAVHPPIAERSPMARPGDSFGVRVHWPCQGDMGGLDSCVVDDVWLPSGLVGGES